MVVGTQKNANKMAVGIRKYMENYGSLVKHKREGPLQCCAITSPVY